MFTFLGYLASEPASALGFPLVCILEEVRVPAPAMQAEQARHLFLSPGR